MEENDHSEHANVADVIPDPRRLVAVLADSAKLRVFAALVLAHAGSAEAAEAEASGESAASTGTTASGESTSSPQSARPSPPGLTLAEAAELAGVGEGEANKALVNLTVLGLARRVGDDRYLATPGVFRSSLSELNRKRDEAAAKTFSTTDPARLSVLLGCFRDGKLVYLPEKFGKRLIVLEEVAQSFEPGVRYAEAEVNLMLRDLYPDYAALRRYLVDSAFLSREDGFYWRSGGTVRV
jgi:hypothetical protein